MNLIIPHVITFNFVSQNKLYLMQYLLFSIKFLSNLFNKETLHHVFNIEFF